MNRKRIIALCILIICFAVPAVTWARSYPCKKCGSNRTTIDATRDAPKYDNASRHSMLCHYTTTCLNCGYVRHSQNTEYESHTFNSKVGKKWPGLNCKEVVYTCRACKYSYTKYMPIDPKKPYAIPQ